MKIYQRKYVKNEGRNDRLIISIELDVAEHDLVQAYSLVKGMFFGPALRELIKKEVVNIDERNVIKRLALKARDYWHHNVSKFTDFSEFKTHVLEELVSNGVTFAMAKEVTKQLDELCYE